MTLIIILARYKTSVGKWNFPGSVFKIMPVKILFFGKILNFPS